jgi:two-component system response regulator
MKHSEITPWVLVCEDDDDDFVLLKRAFEESGNAVFVTRAVDGEGVLPLLLDPSPATGGAAVYPQFILLDLRMPKKDGREVLKQLKAHPELKKIPIIVFTTSRYPGDINRAYQEGANTYLTKPHDFKSLVEMISVVCNYWIRVAEHPLPEAENADALGRKGAA